MFTGHGLQLRDVVSRYCPGEQGPRQSEMDLALAVNVTLFGGHILQLLILLSFISSWYVSSGHEPHTPWVILKYSPKVHISTQSV